MLVQHGSLSKVHVVLAVLTLEAQTGSVPYILPVDSATVTSSGKSNNYRREEKQSSMRSSAIECVTHFERSQLLIFRMSFSLW